MQVEKKCCRGEIGSTLFASKGRGNQMSQASTQKGPNLPSTEGVKRTQQREKKEREEE